MKKTALLLLAGCLLLLGGWHLWAAGSDAPKKPKNLKPVAIVCLTGYDKMMDNVAMLGRASGNREAAKDVIIVLKLLAIQQGMKGPDKAKPWGICVQADGEELTGCAFVPAPDLAQLAETVAPFVGKAESIGGGVYRLRGESNPVYVKQQDDWAFFTYSTDALDSLPEDPVAALDGLNTQYDAAFRLYANNIPFKHRDEIAAWLKSTIEPYARQQSCEPDWAYRMRKQIDDAVLRPTVAAVNDANTLTVGWTLDTTAKKTYFDLALTAKEGSSTAQALNDVLSVKSQFSGFRLPGATLTANWAFRFPPQKFPTVDKLVESFRVLAVDEDKPEEKEKPKSTFQTASRLSADLADLVRAGIGSGMADGGMAVVLKPDTVTLLSGGYVADGAKLNDAVRLIAKAAVDKNPGIAPWIKLDAVEVHSVRIHTLSVPIPSDTKDREKLVALIGQNYELAVGVSEKNAYLAVGRNAEATLKQVIEQSAAGTYQGEPPLELSLAVGPAAKFIAATSPFDNLRYVAKMMALGLDSSAGRDHLKLTAAPVPNGVRYRIEAEEGVFFLLGRLSKAATLEEQ